MGTTATGLILLNSKNGRSEAIIRAFSYKQPFYEPIVGGGLITGLALPIIAQFGSWYFMGGSALLLLIVCLLTQKKYLHTFVK